MKPVKILVRDAQIGAIQYVSSPRARHLNITVKAPDLIRVAIPKRVSLKAARLFVSSHRSWILKHQSRLKSDTTENKKILVPVPPDERAAGMHLASRLSLLASQHQLIYNQVSFRKQRTRWGSCSRLNNISLNLKIAGLPETLQDYILLHELSHTKVKNHGPRFWALLDQLTDGNARIFSKQLRQYRLT